MRTLVLLALATVAAIAAIGAGTPARSASLPAASVAGKGGAPIPKLDWRDCDDGFQCATAKVPLDYDSPRGRTIELALIRAPAADPSRKIGSLFAHPGGSGGASTSADRYLVKK